MNTVTSSTPLAQSRTARSLPQPTVRGFTLIEMLLAISVMSVLLAIAVPSLGAMMRSVRLTSASNTFLSGLYLARSEAIKRNGRVVLCKSADGVACSDSGGWQQGWIVFHDANNNGVRESGEIIIQREEALSGSLRLLGNLNIARYVSFAPTGATKLVGGGFQAGTLTVCNLSAEAGEARQIILNAAGRPRVQRSTVSVCG